MGIPTFSLPLLTNGHVHEHVHGHVYFRLPTVIADSLYHVHVSVFVNESLRYIRGMPPRRPPFIMPIMPAPFICFMSFCIALC